MEKKARLYIVGAGLLLVLMVLSVMLGMAIKQGRLIKQQVYERAGSLFDEVVLMRHWNAAYGGVYVIKKPGAPSNPYLTNPDITDAKGKVYTLKNPATMTREISDYAEKGGKFRFHITALNLKNPHNEPDPWERRALQGFEKGIPEVTEVILEGGHRYYRLMRPLYVEESCLACHSEQGYRVGDVRGGISVTIPYDGSYAALRNNLAGMAGLAVLLVAILTGVLYFFVWRLMDRLARQKKELEVLNETKDRFLGIAAHDLRNPLTVVDGYTELLQGVVSEDSHKDLLNGIKAASEKMLRLINNLLDVSKIKSGKLELRPEDIDVSQFLGECAKSNEITAKKKGITLALSAPGGVGSARFDRERMHQALDNLLSNAFKFSNPGGRVTLGAERLEGNLRFWVADRGVGIKEDELPGIFEEFYKTSARPTAGETTHGLGLAIAKRVVELHGGTIEASSRPGEGTTITITLPL